MMFTHELFVITYYYRCIYSFKETVNHFHLVNKESSKFTVSLSVFLLFVSDR